MSTADSPVPEPLVLERRIPAPRREVWHALTTSAGLRSFLTPRVRVELRRGGPYEICFELEAEPGLQGSEGCRVLSYLHERMLSFTWNAPSHFEEVRWQRTFVVIELGEQGPDATQVRLTHDDWQVGEQWREVYTYFERAWGMFLQALESRFLDGESRDEPAAEDLDELTHFVYYIHPVRPGLVEDPTESEKSVVSEHVRYVRSLLARGRLVLAGPSFPPSHLPTGPDAVALDIPPPGIVVFRARDLSEARSILDRDPGVAAGVFRGQLNTFRPAFLEDIAP